MNYTSIKANVDTFKSFQYEMLAYSLDTLKVEDKQKQALNHSHDELLSFCFKHRLLSISFYQDEKVVNRLNLTEAWVDSNTEKYEPIFNNQYDLLGIVFEITGANNQDTKGFFVQYESILNGSDNDIDKNHTTVVEPDLSNTHIVSL